MFKFIFKTITIIIFLVFLIVGLAIWKGGAPFRWAGQKIIQSGEAVEDFGKVVDKIVEGSQKVHEIGEQIKEITASEDKDTGEKK